jgi:hypothetical protein
MAGTVIIYDFIQGVIVSDVVPSTVSTTAIALNSSRNIATTTRVVFGEGKAHFRLSSFYKL